jgi:drug/metabolite transporter (DMT)-like permease
MTARTAALSAAALCAFAANSLLCRAALGPHSIDGLGFTAVRLVSGALVLGLLAHGVAAPLSESASWRAALALFGYAIAFSLAYVRIGVGTGALAAFGAVQVTMVGAALAGGYRPPAREWAGLLLALLGLVGLTLPGLTRPDAPGLFLMIGAGACWGAYSLLGRGAGPALPANAAAFARTVPLALAALAAGGAVARPHFTGRGVLLAVVSGAVTSGLGYAVWFAALRGLSATQAALLQLVVPPLAAAGGLILLHEAPSARLVLCGLLIIGGIALGLVRRERVA